MAQSGSSASIWKQSPYTMFRDNDQQDEPDEPGNSEEESDVNEEESVNETRQDYFPPVIFSEPPPGYFTEFEAEETEDEDVQFNEQGSLLTDTSTTLGRMSQLVTTDPAISIRNKEVKQQSKIGAKFMDSVTKVPLSDFWHRITQGVAILIFATNVASAIYDLVEAPINLHYKVPSILFGVVANILLVAWFQLRPNVLKSGTGSEDGKTKEDKNTNTNNNNNKQKRDKEKEAKKKEEENEKHKKYQQYAENILHEALLYPIIVLSVFGFANDKMYKIKTDWFSMLQFVLIVIDAIDVFWTQIMRIIMINRFLQDMKSALGDTVKGIGMNILLRGIVTTITNFVLFIFLILLLGAQVHTDNFINEDYHGSVNSTFLLIAVITLPLFNLVVFIAVNYHWVVELLLELGAESKKEDDKKDAKKKKKELKRPGIMNTATELVQSSAAIKKKLEGMRKVHPFKRFISVTTEPLIAVMVVAWEVILVLAVYYFDGCEHTVGCQDTMVQVFFVLIAIASNIHAFIVAVLFNVGVVVVFLGALVYPVSVPLFLRGTSM